MIFRIFACGVAGITVVSYGTWLDIVLLEKIWMSLHFLVLGTEPRASEVLSTRSATKLYAPPFAEAI
jgi:hypothetical protein